jgi:hypothetical protein
MSRVSLSGNPSGTGTFTIASPNSNTDRTLTLPNASGTLNTSGAPNEVPAGSAAAPAIYPTGDTNTGIFFPAADTIAFAEGGAESMRLDSSGNLGLGVTPSAGDIYYRKIELGKVGCGIAAGNASLSSSELTYFTGNAVLTYTGANPWTYGNAGPAGIYSIEDGAHVWRNAPSGTAGNAISFTQDMTLDVSGQLGIGTTSPYSKLDLGPYGSQSQLSWHQDSTTSYGHIGLQNNSAAVGLLAGLKMGASANSFASSISALWGKTAILLNYGNIQFFTNAPDTVAYGTTYTPTERARIDSSGNLLVGATSFVTGGIQKTIVSAGPVSAGFQIQLNGTVGSYIYGYTTGPTGFRVETTGTYPRIEMVPNSGGVVLTSGATSWTSLSDERAKTDLAPITNAAEKVSSLRSVTGRFKTDAPEIRRAFLIAQDVQAVLPEAVTPYQVKDDATEYLGLAYTDVIPLLTAAIQELKADLDATKAELAALKGQA